MAKEKKPFNKILLYILIGLMVLTGSINTIFNKILQKLYGKGLVQSYASLLTTRDVLGLIVHVLLQAYISSICAVY